MSETHIKLLLTEREFTLIRVACILRLNSETIPKDSYVETQAMLKGGKLDINKIEIVNE